MSDLKRFNVFLSDKVTDESRTETYLAASEREAVDLARKDFSSSYDLTEVNDIDFYEYDHCKVCNVQRRIHEIKDDDHEFKGI